MGILEDIFGSGETRKDDPIVAKNESETRDENAKLLLRQEELDIRKNRVQTQIITTSNIHFDGH